MGLSVNVYRNSGTDCTNNGVSKFYDDFVITGDEGVEVSGPFEPSEKQPELRIVKNVFSFGEFLAAYPVDEDGNVKKSGAMFGGNFIYTSDSRFPSKQPIPIHDRYEW